MSEWQWREGRGRGGPCGAPLPLPHTLSEAEVGMAEGLHSGSLAEDGVPGGVALPGVGVAAYAHTLGSCPGPATHSSRGSDTHCP